MTWKSVYDALSKFRYDATIGPKDLLNQLWKMITKNLCFQFIPACFHFWRKAMFQKYRKFCQCMMEWMHSREVLLMPFTFRGWCELCVKIVYVVFSKSTSTKRRKKQCGMHIYFISHSPDRTTSAHVIHVNSVISFLLACNLKVKAIVFLLQLQPPCFSLSRSPMFVLPRI